MSLMCQKTATNICPSAAFINFAIRTFQHLRSAWRVLARGGIVLARGAEVFIIIQFSSSSGGLKDSSSSYVPCR